MHDTREGLQQVGEATRLTRRRWWVRCTVVAKPGVGEVHVHTRVWRPNTTLEMVYITPAGVAYLVPGRLAEAVLAAGSMLAVMAVLRADSA